MIEDSLFTCGIVEMPRLKILEDDDCYVHEVEVRPTSDILDSLSRRSLAVLYVILYAKDFFHEQEIGDMCEWGEVERERKRANLAEAALKRCAEEKDKWIAYCHQETSRLSDEISNLKAKNSCLNAYGSVQEWFDQESRTLRAEARVTELENELRSCKHYAANKVFECVHLKFELERVRKESEMTQVAKQDQAAQTMVEVSTFAVEVQASAEVRDGGCQTSASHGCQHECCKKAVQTAYSSTNLASIVCWKCGKHGHYRSHCWSKGRRRCFACKKVGHI